MSETNKEMKYIKSKTDEKMKPNKQKNTVNQLFYLLYGKTAIWSISYAAKMLVAKTLTAKMLMEKILNRQPPSSTFLHGSLIIQVSEQASPPQRSLPWTTDPLVLPSKSFYYTALYN